MASRNVLLAGRGACAAIVHNALLKNHPDLHVLLDGPVSRTLDGVGARFINIHVGISPAFRGVHGAETASRPVRTCNGRPAFPS